MVGYQKEHERSYALITKNHYFTAPTTCTGRFFCPHFFNGYPLAFLIAVCQYIYMFCIKCFHPSTQVSNSRPHKKNASVWRRRTCPNCGHVFTTDERPRLAHSQQVWHSGSATSDPFNPGVLLVSIATAFGHDPQHGNHVAWDITETVIQTLAVEHPESLSSDDIAAVTHQVLDRYDKKAGMQYGLQHELLTAGSRKRKR